MLGPGSGSSLCPAGDPTLGRQGVVLESLSRSTWAEPPVCPSATVQRLKGVAGERGPSELAGGAWLGGGEPPAAEAGP